MFFNILEFIFAGLLIVGAITVLISLFIEAVHERDYTVIFLLLAVLGLVGLSLMLAVMAANGL